MKPTTIIVAHIGAGESIVYKSHVSTSEPTVLNSYKNIPIIQDWIYKRIESLAKKSKFNKRRK